MIGYSTFGFRVEERTAKYACVIDFGFSGVDYGFDRAPPGVVSDVTARLSNAAAKAQLTFTVVENYLARSVSLKSGSLGSVPVEDCGYTWNHRGAAPKVGLVPVRRSALRDREQNVRADISPAIGHELRKLLYRRAGAWTFRVSKNNEGELA
jgi:hypothetical protein